MNGATVMSEKFACGLDECDCHLADEISMADCLESARKLGEANGKGAASWTIDGNVTESTVRAIVKMVDDGDPALYDQFREPSFSGEYADDYSERSLCDDIGIDYDSSATEDIDRLADAYLDSVREAFWQEVERLYRQAL
jgi:hypothetical protein